MRIPKSRRDPRYTLGPDTAFVEFRHPRTGQHVQAVLTTLCISGLAFETGPDGPELEPDMLLERATVRIEDCVLSGDVLIKNRAALEPGGWEFGGLFYPATVEDERHWISVISGMRAVAAAARGSS